VVIPRVGGWVACCAKAGFTAPRHKMKLRTTAKNVANFFMDYSEFFGFSKTDFPSKQGNRNNNLMLLITSQASNLNLF
jgi:hypothetical protein